MSTTHSFEMETISLPRSPFPKSPMPKSPFPKSPMPKSPMPTSPELYEKYKSRCIYGLISFLHFRRSHSKKLISDRRCLNRDAISNEYTRNMLDSGKGGVQKIMDLPNEQKKRKKKTAAKLEQVKSDPELGDLPRNHRKGNKVSRRPRRLPIYGCYDVATMGYGKPVNENLLDMSSKKLDSAVTVEAHATQVHPKDQRNCNNKSVKCVRCEKPNEINVQVHMNEAAEAFVNQKLIDGNHLSEDGASHPSKHFLDALDVLNSNKDLFIKLLQDPNSLLVKHIEELRDSQLNDQGSSCLTEAKVSEHGRSNSDKYKERTSAENFKSSDNLSVKTVDSQPLENMVVLMTGSTSLQDCSDKISRDPPQVHYSLRNVRQSVKPSLFSFEQMKKKFSNAMGLSRKEEQLMLTHKPACKFQGFEKNHEKGKDQENVGRNSSDKAYFDMGVIDVSSMDEKRTEQINEVKIFESGRGDPASVCGSNNENSNLSTFRHLKRNTYIENRIHQSELKNGNANYLGKQRPNLWNGGTWIPEYDLSTAASHRRKGELLSPVRRTKLELATPQMRFSPYNNYQIDSKNRWSNQRDKKNRCVSPLIQNAEAPSGADNKDCCDRLQLLEAKLNISDKLFPDAKVHGSIYMLNDLHPKGAINIMETRDNKSSEEIIPGLPFRLDSSRSNGATQSTDTADACNKNQSWDLSRPDSPLENQTSPSSTGDYCSSPSSIQREEVFGGIKDRAEQPSPISVLEQFCTEEIPSPLSTESRTAQPSFLPIQDRIDDGQLPSISQFDLKINPSVEEQKFLIDYVCGVLQLSCFDWNELALKCHSSDQLLDRSLFDKIDVLRRDNNRLLFDYVNEVLVEVCQCDLRCSPWLSVIKPQIWSAAKVEDLVNLTFKHVDWNLLLEPSATMLEQLVEKDLSKCQTWMFARAETEDIVSEMIDSILEELTVETAYE